MAAFTLAHLSDPHLPPLPAAGFRDLAGKRALGYLNWARNRHKYHRREVLDALVADMRAQRPDHIAVTGDLVNLALEAEFSPAQVWLESVGAPQRVTVIPGNHDAYVRATRHRFVGTFGDYLRGDAAVDGVAFPFVRRRGPLALIGLSSAEPSRKPNTNSPSPPRRFGGCSATGSTIGVATIACSRSIMRRAT